MKTKTYKKTELLPETETKFFKENERNDLSDGEILRKEKDFREESKTHFPFLNL